MTLRDFLLRHMRVEAEATAAADADQCVAYLGSAV
jgi:hypothetical protein